MRQRSVGVASRSSTSVDTKIALLKRERDEALEQQRATSEVLRAISNSPTDTASTLSAIAESVARLLEVTDAEIMSVEGDALRSVAKHGSASQWPMGTTRLMSRDWVTGRAVIDRAIVHVADLQASERDFPQGAAYARQFGHRTILAVPLLREGSAIGAFLIRRMAVKPFTDKQIALVQNFAAQAVIAIENTRLLNELRQRTDDLTQSLEQQTATSEVLKVISSSPGELEPVFNAMLENATRICEAKVGNLFLFDGDDYRAVAVHGNSDYADWFRRDPMARAREQSGSPLDRLTRTKQVIHIPDLRLDQSYIDGNRRMVSLVETAGARTHLVVPMLKDRELVGAIVIYRQEVRPFTEKQIALVQNFAAQAVIAIENTRLLSELRQSLEQQTATSEVLGVISSSPGELQPVFQTMLENATRICEANFGFLQLCESETFRMAAMHNAPPAFAQAIAQREPSFRPSPLTPLGRMVATKQLVHVADYGQEPAYKRRDPAAVRTFELAGARSVIFVPMLKDDVLIGTITIYRQEVRPFTDKQIALVQNFAAQAVIAIENTRLLSELRESLEQQTATSEVLKVISSSPGDLEPVFQAMLENATRICEANFGVLNLHETGTFRVGATHNVPSAFADFLHDHRYGYQPTPGGFLERVMRTKKVSHSADNAAETASRATTLGGARSAVCVPMLKDDVLVGTFTIYRQEVRPFTDKQIDLVKNFAAQAVIAIENTRLLNELRQSLEQQTATAEVLSVISSSPGELQPVFQAMLESADAHLRRQVRQAVSFRWKNRWSSRRRRQKF